MKVLAATSTWSNDGNITMEISKQQVQVQALKLSNGSQIISAKGIIGLVENMNMKLKIENADVSGFLALAGLDLPLGGNLNAEIGVEGSYLLPHISGSVNVRGAAAGGLSFDNIPSSFNYADKKLQFKTLAEKSGKTIFSAEGIIPVDLSFTTIKERLLHKGLSVSIKASGLGLDIVPMFSEQVKSSSGDMRADIHIEGDPYLPQISGNINISGGSLSLLATGADYRDINAGITLNGNEILLRELNLKSGSGSAKLTGKIMMKGFIPEDAELNLTCRNFNVMKTSLFTGDIDSDITIKGLHASGTVTLDQGVVNIPSQSKAQLSEIEFVQAKPGGGTVKVPSVNEEPEFYKQLVLDVRVSIPGKAWVYGQSITVDVKGDFNVTKERNGPMLYDGEIDITRGFYKINERTLNITDGRILARKDVFMSSFINAKASCKVGDVSIEVILGGTIDNPIITFTSEPPMERSEIISYLAFGAPSGKLSQPQSSALQNTSFDLVAGFAEKDIKGVVGRVVSIDELTIKPSEGSWGVGKYITDKLFAKYEWRSGLDESPQTVLDYMLDRHFSLNSQIGDPKTSGVDLFWKIGY
jgi:translocation and assembly module TamB